MTESLRGWRGGGVSRRANEQGAGLGGSRGAGRSEAAGCELRAADARVVGWGARRLRSARGEGETCSRAAEADRRCARRMRVGRWTVRLRRPIPPKTRLGCVARLKVIRSGMLPYSMHERAEARGATKQRATTASVAS